MALAWHVRSLTPWSAARISRVADPRTTSSIVRLVATVALILSRVAIVPEVRNL